MTRYIVLAFAWICFLTGCIGIVVPLLPTTPLVLLATVLFARCSPRCYDYIQSTKVYKTYVVAFRDAGGVPMKAKVKMLALSYTVIGISAVVAAKPLVWGILSVVSAFLFWLMMIHIPTVKTDTPSTSPSPTSVNTTNQTEISYRPELANQPE